MIETKGELETEDLEHRFEEEFEKRFGRIVVVILGNDRQKSAKIQSKMTILLSTNL